MTTTRKNAAPKNGAKPKTAKPDESDKKKLLLSESDYGGKSRERIMAEISQSPIYGNAKTSHTFATGDFGEIGFTEYVAEMKGSVAKVQGGDLSGIEATLTAQAICLDKIFNELARRAAMNMGEHLAATEIYLRQAFKAQAQCRCTIEALAEIKNPRQVAFVRQANIAHGPQQVNNGVTGEAHTQGNNPNQSNELSGAGHELLPDTRASQAQSRINPQLEAVGAIQRATD